MDSGGLGYGPIPASILVPLLCKARTVCHMPCALCLLGFEMHPLYECVPSPSAFETTLPLQPRLGFNYELFFLFLQLLPTHYTCRGLLLHVITLRHTTLARISLDKGSARRRDLYWTTHNTRDRCPSPRWGLNCNPCKRAAADLRFRPCGHP